MEKSIKKSRRGLTFSFQPTKNLNVGSRYDYIIEKSGTIRIEPAAAGKYKVSRKRNGSRWDPLIDLRNKEVLDTITQMDSIRISISGDRILISDAATKKKAVILEFPRRELCTLRMAAGMEDVSAVDYLLDAAQISFDEYLANSRQSVSIPTIQRDLADVFTVVSLFSGAGILDWAFFKDDRFHIQYAIDYDEAACTTYRKNIGLHIVHGDIHKAFTNQGYPLDDTVKNPDVIIGGPSCKPFSNANRHTRLSDHPDSDLVLQYMRIVKTLHPKVFAMENVPAVLTACDGAYFEAIKQTADECGYNIEAKIIQDNKVGGYTTRKRAIILGSRIGPAAFPALSLCGKTAGEALGAVTPGWKNFSDITLPGPDTRRRMSFVPQGGNYEDIPPEYRTASKNRHSCTYRRLAWDEPSPTIVNWRKPPLIHPLEDRTLTVAEAKALQGLPADFEICGSLGQKQQQVGNSVPVAIGRYIKNALLFLLRKKDAAPEYYLSPC